MNNNTITRLMSIFTYSDIPNTPKVAERSSFIAKTAPEEVDDA